MEKNNIKYKKISRISLIITFILVIIIAVVLLKFYEIKKVENSYENLSEFASNNEDSIIVSDTDNPNGNSLSLKNIKIDNGKLVAKYELTVENNSKMILDINKIYIDQQSRLEVGNDIYVLGAHNTTTNYCINTINNEKYEISYLYDVEGIEFSEKIKFISELSMYEELNENSTDLELIGKWNVEKEIEEKLKNKYDVTYKFNNKNVKTTPITEDEFSSATLQVLQIKELEDFVILSVIATEYTTEPGINYKIDVLDENNNTLLVNQDENIFGGIVQDILLKKFDLNSKITVSITEYESDSFKELSKGNLAINLLEEKEENEIKEKQIVTEWRGIGLTYDINVLENTPNYIYNEYSSLEDDLATINMNIHRYIGDYKQIAGYINIHKYENKFEYKLEEIDEKALELLWLNKIFERQSEYTVFRNTGEYKQFDDMKEPIYEEYTLNYEQAIKLYSGETINIDGKEISEEYLNQYNEEIKVEYKNKEKTKIDGIDAITYVVDNGETERHYVFIKDNQVYQIKTPLILDCQKDIEEFVQNIKLEQ